MLSRPAACLVATAPPIVSPEAWEMARQEMLVKEKAQTRARDALAAERRRMPWMAVEKNYVFEGPNGKVSLLDLFEGRHQLIVYRAFFEPGVLGWPDHACRGCSLLADQVAHLAHVNARDTTLVYASRAPQPDLARYAIEGLATARYFASGDQQRVGDDQHGERRDRGTRPGQPEQGRAGQ